MQALVLLVMHLAAGTPGSRLHKHCGSDELGRMGIIQCCQPPAPLCSLVGDAVLCCYMCLLCHTIMICVIFSAPHPSFLSLRPLLLPLACRLAASAKGERGQAAEATGTIAAAELLELLATGACVDEHLADQLVIFMALAKGRWALGTGHADCTCALNHLESRCCTDAGLHWATALLVLLNTGCGAFTGWWQQHSTAYPAQHST